VSHTADDLAVRVEAIESLLVERGLVDPDAIDDVVEYYETSVGPLNGAQVVARAWTDPAYRQRLRADATRAVAELGFGGPEGQMIIAVENTSAVHNVVVCTLCSCYPWPVLGLPPRWYKSLEYRSRMVAEPRKVLSEMGLDLPAETRIRVWDSSAEGRYMVVPDRPPGTDHLDAEQLARLVTRDAMIGVGRALSPDAVQDG
jgi:nitrile hydratase